MLTATGVTAFADDAPSGSTTQASAEQTSGVPLTDINGKAVTDANG